LNSSDECFKERGKLSGGRLRLIDHIIQVLLEIKVEGVGHLGSQDDCLNSRNISSVIETLWYVHYDLLCLRKLSTKGEDFFHDKSKPGENEKMEPFLER